MTREEAIKQLKSFLNKIIKANTRKEPYMYGWVEGYMTLEDEEAVKMAINALSFPNKQEIIDNLKTKLSDASDIDGNLSSYTRFYNKGIYRAIYERCKQYY